jgi:cytochrome P450
MTALQAVVIPSSPLRTFRTLRRLVRNPMDAWPRAIYANPLVVTRLLGRRTAYVTDPDLLQQVLIEDAAKYIKGERMRRVLEPALGRGILIAEGAQWRQQRRTAAPVFRPARIDGFAPAFIAAARALRDRWLALPDGTEFDVAREMMHVTFDIILETMLSGRSGIDVDQAERSFRSFLETTGWAVAMAVLRAPDWLPYPGKGNARQARGYLRGVLAARLAERRRTGERHDDLLSLLLDSRDPETGDAMDDSMIVDNILTFVAAGHETTALALTWTFHLLGRHPEVAAEVLAEIASVTGGAPVEAAQLGALPYTRQVIQEAMRLYPPAALVLRQPTEPVQLGSVQLAPGDTVLIPIYALHRSPALWDAPERFDPTRFAPEAVKARHRCAYLPFGAGPRNCIGMGFALQEAVAILATLLPAVSLHAAAGFEPKPRLRVTLRPAHGMPMRRERRVPA